MLKIHKNTRNSRSNMRQHQTTLSSKELLFAEADSSYQISLQELSLWNHSLSQQKNKLRGMDEAENYPDEIQSFDGSESFIQKVQRIVEARLSDADFDVDRLSYEMSLSRTHLCQKLKSYTDHSPAELIRNFRLTRAATMLTHGSSTVSEIAYKTGFNDLSHFSKSFKKVFGVCPSQYQAYEVFRYEGAIPQYMR
jgi:AraC-like DNA-binding protein